MVAHRPFEHPTTVVELSHNEIPSDSKALFGVFGPCILRFSQQHVSALLAVCACKETTLPIEERQADAPFDASTHKGRTCTSVREAEDTLKRMERHSSKLCAIATYNHVLPIEHEIRVFREHVKRVEQMSHSSSSKSLLATYSPTVARLMARGRQRSFNEHDRQAEKGFTRGV